ncbi:MAG TPA: DNA polymerase III subunit chi [Candidatus Binatia bacterium]|nr:DNA polymerase III subunit chi [Candidatus Binatia bacterium]
MPRIDFYVVPEDSAEDALPVACRLCEKAAISGRKVHVHVPDAAMAATFDKLLWTFRQGGFVAHERAGGSTDADMAAVLIGDAAPPPPQREILLNLGEQVPDFFDRFERVLEIVAGDAAARASSRARFKAYRDKGLSPETIKLASETRPA